MKKLLLTLSFLMSIAANAIPNPAAVNCQKLGLTYVLINNTGICIFSDDTYCEEWALMRNQCMQGENVFPEGGYDAMQSANYCIQGNKVTLCH